jgi:hypothetical protein
MYERIYIYNLINSVLQYSRSQLQIFICTEYRTRDVVL